MTKQMHEENSSRQASNLLKINMGDLKTMGKIKE